MLLATLSSCHSRCCWGASKKNFKCLPARILELEQCFEPSPMILLVRAKQGCLRFPALVGEQGPGAIYLKAVGHCVSSSTAAVYVHASS